MALALANQIASKDQSEHQSNCAISTEDIWLATPPLVILTPSRSNNRCRKLDNLPIKMYSLFSEFPQLKPFVLSNVRPTGVRIGAGAYGSVGEVAIPPGAICAAKKIHELFLDRSEIPAAEIRRATVQFVGECELMSSLRHPNIVQFLGIAFFPNSRLPALVMERLMTSLHDLLDPESPPSPDAPTPFFPLSLKYSILHNVACGLAYLHEQTPPVAHRDLSARNVLVNSGMVAKIADLGVARILPRMRAATMTKGPGAIIYMPPEAMEDKPEEEKDNDGEGKKSKARYDASIDVFSFGVVSIFTLSQTFPSNLLPTAYKKGGRLPARSELERRERYMRMIYNQLREKHPLLRMIEGCLNFPEDRPCISEVLHLLEEARIEVRDGHASMNKLELLQNLQNKPGSEVR